MKAAQDDTDRIGSLEKWKIEHHNNNIEEGGGEASAGGNKSVRSYKTNKNNNYNSEKISKI